MPPRALAPVGSVMMRRRVPVAGSQIRAVASPLAVARGPVRGEHHPIHGPGVADEGTQAGAIGGSQIRTLRVRLDGALGRTVWPLLEVALGTS
jgi:hypothetical protein